MPDRRTSLSPVADFMRQELWLLVDRIIDECNVDEQRLLVDELVDAADALQESLDEAVRVISASAGFGDPKVISSEVDQPATVDSGRSQMAVESLGSFVCWNCGRLRAGADRAYELPMPVCGMCVESSR